MANQPEWMDDYHRLTEGAGYVCLEPAWTDLRVGGTDRAKFLHGLCTNDIRRLEAGQGCEAFVTQVQGKTLGHGIVLADSDALWVLGAPGQASTLLKHWEFYHIREDVVMQDETPAYRTLLVGGQEVVSRLAENGIQLPVRTRYSHVLVETNVGESRWIWFDPEASVLLAVVAEKDLAKWTEWLEHVGVSACQVGAWEALRLELGWPMFGRDIRPENFPQEVGRDALAISFTKGCYLGQETVARIDALGHVNRVLRGLRWPSDFPCHVDTPYQHQGKIAAFVTSASYSPRLRGTLALGYVRRAWQEPGSFVPLGDNCSAEVLALPLKPT